MFIVFYVYKQSMKPGEKQQTNHFQYFFFPWNTPTHSRSDGPCHGCGCSWNVGIVMAGKVINSVTGGQHWVLQTRDANSLRAPLARAVVYSLHPISINFWAIYRKLFGLWQFNLPDVTQDAFSHAKVLIFLCDKLLPHSPRKGNSTSHFYWVNAIHRPLLEEQPFSLWDFPCLARKDE